MRDERIERMEAALNIVSGRRSSLSWRSSEVALWVSGAVSVLDAADGRFSWRLSLSAFVLSGMLLVVLGWFFEWYAALLVILPEDGQMPPDDEQKRIGGNLRHVSPAQWVRDHGYDIPAGSVRGVNVWPRYAHAVLSSGAMNRAAAIPEIIPNGDDTREWVQDFQRFFCLCGWAEPRHGWNGDEPDLSGGISQIHDEGMEMLRLIERKGRDGVLHLLQERIEDGDPPTPRRALPRT